MNGYSKAALVCCLAAGLGSAAFSLPASRPQPPALAEKVALTGDQQVEVLPILFVPADNTGIQMHAEERIADLLTAHLRVAQESYRRLMVTDTFKIAPGRPMVYRSTHPHSYYLPASWSEADRKAWERAHPQGAEGSLLMLNEIFERRNENRYTGKYIYLIVYARPGPPASFDQGPTFGSAQPINGLPSSGGGVAAIELSSLMNDEPQPFQSTLMLLLGLSFGLSHSSCYGYSQKDSGTIMSFDPKLATKGTEPSRGILVPEDYVVLSMNKLTFPNFSYREAEHNARGTTIDRIQTCFHSALPEFAGKFVEQQRAGTGYELFHDGRRVSGSDAEFRSLKFARDNCRWNLANRRDVKVTCRYEGKDFNPGPWPAVPNLDGAWCEDGTYPSKIEQQGERLTFHIRGHVATGYISSNDSDVYDMVFAQDWDNAARFSTSARRLDWRTKHVWLRQSKCGG